MGTPPAQVGLTYDDLRGFPEDQLRREIIDGELLVTASPATRHQRVVARFTAALSRYEDDHGGVVLPGPTDVLLADDTVLVPDVVFIRRDHLDRIEDQLVRSAPDVVIEVSSPTTRRTDLVRKRAIYERHGVPEYWFVDLDADQIHAYRPDEGGAYGAPTVHLAGDSLTTPILPGLEIPVVDVLGRTS